MIHIKQGREKCNEVDSTPKTSLRRRRCHFPLGSDWRWKSVSDVSPDDLVHSGAKGRDREGEWTDTDGRREREREKQREKRGKQSN